MWVYSGVGQVMVWVVGMAAWWVTATWVVARWVASVVVGGFCCDSGGCAIVVNGDDMEEIIYYFNV